MEPLSAVPPGVRQIVVAVEASLEKLVSAAAEAIWAEVAAYAASPDDQLRNDVTAHIRGIFLAFVAGLRTGQPARRADFAAGREQASRRVVQGITLAISSRHSGSGSSRCGRACSTRPAMTPWPVTPRCRSWRASCR